MEIHERAAGAVTVLQPVGRLVLSEGSRDSLLKDMICARMTEGRRHFLLDLAQVSQIDTSGLTMLVAAHMAAVKRGGQIKLLHPTKRIHELLSVTKLNTFFEVFDSEESALRSFPPGAAV
ncbi:MAG: STAS domain-containing protein [Acidobacteria bacterium]|nr:STAS domain-containing protein [Acidobacteriota bacterium]